MHQMTLFASWAVPLIAIQNSRSGFDMGPSVTKSESLQGVGLELGRSAYYCNPSGPNASCEQLRRFFG